MKLFNISILSGNRNDLIERLVDEGELPSEKIKILNNAPIDTLVKLNADIPVYKSGLKPDAAKEVKICFIKSFGELIRILICIPGQENFSCYGLLDAIDYLRKKGIEINESLEIVLNYLFKNAVFAFELGILKHS